MEQAVKPEKIVVVTMFIVMPLALSDYIGFVLRRNTDTLELIHQDR